MTARARRRRRSRSSTQKGTLRFIGYTRVSTRDQDENGVSLIAQRDRLRGWATAHGYELLRVERESGISGTVAPDKRPAMARALKSIKSGEADGIVAIKLDRLSRSVRDMLNLAERFQEKGWLLATVDESIDTNSATGRLLLNILSSMAQWERDMISERTIAGLDAIAREGRPRSRFAPYGWRTARGGIKTVRGDRAPLVKHAEEQRALRRMIRLREKGEGPQAIANTLNAEKRYNRRGRTWSRQSVWQVLDTYDAREEARAETA